MLLRNILILRNPCSGCLEGRTALLQPIGTSSTNLFAEVKGHVLI
jgi:hypothetical protein